VTEEFREKLQMMRSARTVVNGNAVAPGPDEAARLRQK
jgi:hypothetical protein